MEFEKIFETLTGHTPFPWQKRLYGEFVRGHLPSTLDLPTGLGKTSVIAIWLAARAAGADVPRRLVYVVDRRAVVDQATEIAESIAGRLGRDGDIANCHVHTLRSGLGLGGTSALPVSTLRGQHVDNRDWLQSPTTPAIVVGTIDMIGSRLLFQAYGVSPRMRPVHAALLGADSLVVLDEAHLVPPFEHLLRSIEAWPRADGIPPLRLLALSATGRTEGSAPFRLTAADLDDPRTSNRLRATKRLRIEDSNGELATTLAQRAFELAGTSERVIVFCDSRKIAQKVAERLGVLARTKFGKESPMPRLLIGARRVWERAKLAEDPVFARFRPQLTPLVEISASVPAFLVATSAGEVGVDLDADHLVMDLVPWERMVQRLGRVNRRSEPGESLVDVFVAAPEKDAESGKDTEQILSWRAPFDSEGWPKDRDGRVDASPIALLRLKEHVELARRISTACTEEPLHPDLSPPLLEAWAMTSLDDHPGRPNVAPWLRGWIDDEPQTRLVWRRLLPVRPEDWADGANSALVTKLNRFFASAGPHLSETLDVPTYQVVDLLRRRVKAYLRSSSIEGEARLEPGPPLLIVILDSRDEVQAARRIEKFEDVNSDDLFRLLVGRTLVVDARLGGLDADGLLADQLDDGLVTLDGSPAVDTWARTAQFRVRKAKRTDTEDLTDWLIEQRFDLNDEDNEEGDELRIEVLRTKGVTIVGDAAIARREQKLSEHHAWTAESAERIAETLNFSADHKRALVAAAAGHDAGKARELWQNAMRAPRKDRPYAKTKGGGTFHALMVDGAIYRHEFGSVSDAEHDPAILALPENLRDLALHLIAAHHGYARPVIAPIDPNEPPPSTIERARTIALRFHRVQRVWGPWGLAWWESLLRAADWAASRAVNEGRGSN